MFDNSVVQELVEQFYPASAIRLLEKNGTKSIALKPGQKFSDVSPVLRRIVANVDAWPIPPAGLFVVEERSIYLRSLSPMTIAHEFAHALDCALGGGVYLSGVDPRIPRAFSAATAFVTPYAASGCDEYAAECIRSWVEVNDPHSLWPNVSRERLAQVDPTMYGIISSIFDDIEARFGGRAGEQLTMDFAA